MEDGLSPVCRVACCGLGILCFSPACFSHEDCKWRNGGRWGDAATGCGCRGVWDAKSARYKPLEGRWTAEAVGKADQHLKGRKGGTPRLEQGH